jgi:hypothetical protein
LPLRSAGLLRANISAGRSAPLERAVSSLHDEMQGVFDAIWSGRECGACALRSICPAPLDMPARKPRTLSRG